MKKRRTLIISLLLIAALCLGIGYAAYSVNLDIIGTVSAGAPAPKVIFKDVSESITQGTIVSQDNYGRSSLGGQSIDLNVQGFREVEDSVVVTYTVENGHDFPVTVTKPSVSYTNADTNYQNHFLIETSEWAGLTEGKINAEGTATFTVTITLKKTFANDSGSTALQNFLIKFTATAVNG